MTKTNKRAALTSLNASRKRNESVRESLTKSREDWMQSWTLRLKSVVDLRQTACL